MNIIYVWRHLCVNTFSINAFIIKRASNKFLLQYSLLLFYHWLMSDYLLSEIKDNPSTQNNRLQKVGFIGLSLFGCASIALLSFSLPFVVPAFRRIVLPFIPATDSQVSNVLQIIRQQKKPSSVIDLGSGDGRIVCSSFYTLHHSLKSCYQFA